jgi:hypothetical protein
MRAGFRRPEIESTEKRSEARLEIASCEGEGDARRRQQRPASFHRETVRLRRLFDDCLSWVEADDLNQLPRVIDEPNVTGVV